MSNLTELPGLLASYLSPEKVAEIAREQGVIQRQRDFDPYVFMCVLLLGFQQSPERSVSSLGRIYGHHSAKPLSDSSFRERFTPQMVACFQAMYGHLAQQMLAHPGLRQGLLAYFSDVLLADSSIVTLHQSLRKLFPGVATPAAAKIHLVLSATGSSPAQVRLTAGTHSDHRLLAINERVKGKLLLMDLGYTSLGLLDRIDTHGGFFVARLKQNANPLVIHDWVQQQTAAPIRLDDYLSYGQDFDLECQFTFNKRPWRGIRRKVSRNWRVVCLWKADTEEWMLYVTNLPASEFTPEEIGCLYRARWLIELAFDELKTGYGLDRFQVRNPHAVEVLIYAALMTLLVSRHLVHHLCREWKLNSIPLKCWWKLFCESVTQLLAWLMDPDSWNPQKEKRLKRIWHKALTESHRHRMGLLEQVQKGIFYGDRAHVRL